jgi:hypothetical protein
MPTDGWRILATIYDDGRFRAAAKSRSGKFLNRMNRM